MENRVRELEKAVAELRAQLALLQAQPRRTLTVPKNG